MLACSGHRISSPRTLPARHCGQRPCSAPQRAWTSSQTSNSGRQLPIFVLRHADSDIRSPKTRRAPNCADQGVKNRKCRILATANAGHAETSTSRHAVVVGAGPAGCLISMLLAQRGWRVDVVEKRPEPAPDASTPSKQRSWVLALYPRGIQAIQRVAELPVIQQRRYKGLVVMPRAANGRSIVLERVGALIDRTTLANSLLAYARQHYTHLVTFHFDTPVSSIDLKARRVNYQPGGSQGMVPEHLGYELLVGADGSGSVVRQALLEAFPREVQLLQPKGVLQELCEPTSEYKAFYGLDAVQAVQQWDPDAGLPNRAPGHYFFVLGTAKPNTFVTVCSDGDGGSYCGYVMMPQGAHQAASKEDYVAMLRSTNPPLPEAWIQPLACKLHEAPASRLPTMRAMTRFFAPGVALIGDAAHTVTPALGQGVNAALADAVLLDEALAQAPHDLDQALRSFSAQRLPEIAALQQLEALQSCMLAPLRPEQGDLPAQLLNKWLIFSYFGLRTIVGMASNQAQVFFKWAASITKGLQHSQLQPDPPGLIRNPPMFELYTGDLTYTAMLNIIRLYGIASTIISASLLLATASALNGIGTAAASAVAAAVAAP